MASMAAPAPAAAGPSMAATPAHVSHCFATLHAQLAGEPAPTPSFEDALCPLFVTWMKIPGRLLDTYRSADAKGHGDPRLALRGCIGTLEPRRLHAALRDYTLNSALRDGRFQPVSLSELPSLECTVSLLTDFEVGAHYADWDVGLHGIIVEFKGDGRGRHADASGGRMYSATYLPEIAAREGWSHVETIDSLVAKSGYRGRVDEALRRSIRLTRYQSSLCSLTHREWLGNGGAASH